MSHEITSTDNLVLHKQEAWHGMGTVVETAPTPGQALTLANLDWQVEQTEMYLADRVPVPSHKAVVRSDNDEILSVLGTGYNPLQNEELAMFAYDLAGEADVRVESAGSLKGGRRVWFLLKAETLCVGNDCDEVEPYVLLYNSHDGTSAVEFMPTSIRVVCNNTLTYSRNNAKGGFKFRHTTNMRDNISGGVRAMQACLKHVELWSKEMSDLAAMDVTGGWLTRFYESAYHRYVRSEPDWGTKAYDSWLTKRDDTVRIWTSTFDREASEAGCKPSRWLAANSVTHWMDHTKPVRMTTRGLHANVDEAKQWDRLFGTSATRKEQVFERAAELAAV